MQRDSSDVQHNRSGAARIPSRQARAQPAMTTRVLPSRRRGHDQLRPSGHPGHVDKCPIPVDNPGRFGLVRGPAHAGRASRPPCWRRRGVACDDGNACTAAHCCDASRACKNARRFFRNPTQSHGTDPPGWEAPWAPPCTPPCAGPWPPGWPRSCPGSGTSLCTRPSRATGVQEVVIAEGEDLAGVVRHRRRRWIVGGVRRRQRVHPGRARAAARGTANPGPGTGVDGPCGRAQTQVNPGGGECAEFGLWWRSWRQGAEAT